MKLPKLWKKKGRGGKYTGNFFSTIKGADVNLGTKNANTATKRLGEALRSGKRNFVDDVEAAAAALEPNVEAAAAVSAGGLGQLGPTGEPAAATTPTAPAAPPSAPDAEAVQPDAVITPLRQLLPVPPATSAAEEAAATNAAATEAGAAGGDDAGDAAADAAEAARKQQIGDKELAKFGVEVQLFTAAQWAKYKVWKGFNPPQLPDEAKAPLAEQWEKIIAYANVGAMLPPWVTGLVIPGVTIVMSTAVIAAAYAELAAQQKAQSGEKPKQDAGSGAQAMAA